MDMNREMATRLLENASSEISRTGIHADFWDKVAERKASLFKAFGNKLTVYKAIELHKTEDQLIEEIRMGGMSSVSSQLFMLFEYASANGVFYPRKFRTYIVRPDVLAKKVFQENMVFEEEGYITVKISKGAKISKFINKLSGFDGWKKESFLNEYSKVFNEATIKGNLAISIDPIEILTASVNGYNWSSCFNIYEGEYKASVIDYLSDSKSFIVYLTTREMECGNAIKFDDKKWRNWCSVGDTCFTVGKGYPYIDNSLNQEVAEFVNEVFGDIYDTTNNNSGVTRVQLNDTSYSDGAFLSFALKGQDVDSCIYTDTMFCPCCGKEVSYMATGLELVCEDCSDSVYCYDCGETIPLDEAIRDNDGDCFCECCYDNRYHGCEACGCELQNGDGDYCDSCREELFHECSYCGEQLHKDFDSYEFDSDGDVVCPECADSHYNRCADCGDLIGRCEDYCENCTPEDEED